MSGYAYEYDATGTKPENVVRVEQHPISNYTNKWRNIIPEFAPFYRKDLIIKVNNVRLIEGIDYYLGHYFEEASIENKLPIFGSIMIADSELTGTLTFELYRTLGGQFTIPVNEALTYLSKDNKDPRNCDWEDIYKYPVKIPSLNAPTTLEEAILIDPVLRELYNYSQAKGEWFKTLEAMYTKFTTAIVNLENDLVSSKYQTHLFKTNPHKLTAAQLGAHTRADKVTSSNKIFGYDLHAFNALVLSSGLNYDSLDTLYTNSGEVIEGNIWLDEDAGIYDYSEAMSVLSLPNDKVSVLAKNELILDTNGEGFSANAGANIFSIIKYKGVQNNYGLMYNGYNVITSGIILEYLPPVSALSKLIFTENTDSLSWVGDGSITNPLRANAVVPLASYVTYGKAIISNRVTDVRSNIVATPYSVSLVKAQVDSLADNFITVNGKPLTANIMITKADIADVDNIDNTAAMSKEASSAFLEAVDLLAEAGHKHTDMDAGELSQATETTPGVAQIGNILNEETARVAHPSLLTPVKELAEPALELEHGLVPGDAFDAVQFGGNSYLPIPVQGTYGDSGFGGNGSAAVLESDNTLVILRNGASVSGKGVYYFTAKLNSAYEVVSSNTSNTRYEPAEIVNKGDRVSSVVHGGEGVLGVVTEKGDYYVVLTRGTMNSDHHRCVKVNSERPKSTGRRIVIAGGYVYYVAYFGSRFSFEIDRISLKEIEYNDEVELTRVLISGQPFRDEYINDAETFNFTLESSSTDENASAIIHRQDNGKWVHVNHQHATHNFMVCANQDTIRILTSGRVYCSNSYTSMGGSMWCCSFDFNIKTGEIVMHDMDNLPMVLSETSLTSPFHGVGYPAGYVPNDLAFTTILNNKALCTARNYGTQYIPRGLVCRSSSNRNIFDFLRWDNHDCLISASFQLAGAYGSVIKGQNVGVNFLTNNSLITFQKDDNKLIYQEYDPNTSYVDDNGFGPTSNRSIISDDINQISRIPKLWINNVDSKEGIIFTPNYLSGPTKMVGMTLSSHWFCNSNVIEDLRYLCRESRRATVPDELFRSDTVSLRIFGNPMNPIASMVVYHELRYSDNTKTNGVATNFYFRVTYQSSGVNIISAEIGELLTEIVVSGTATGIGSEDLTNKYGCDHLFTLPSGEMGIIINNVPTIGYIGNSGQSSLTLLEKVAGDDSEYHIQKLSIHEYNASGRAYHPNLGLFYLSNHHSGEGIIANVIGRNLEEILNGRLIESAVIAASQVVSGWNVYFSEEISLYYENTYLTLPITSIDLSLIPGVYKHTTFHVFINIDSEHNTSYTVEREKLKDVKGKYWIGTIVTGETEILELNLERFSRIGKIRNIEKHDAYADAHGDNLPSLEKEYFGFGGIDNKGLTSDTVETTQLHVISNWKRISHSPTTEAQPSNWSDLNVWSHRKSSDYVECQINANRFIGIVDYNTYTELSLDVDIIGNNVTPTGAAIVVLAYVLHEGRECTISAVRNLGTPSAVNCRNNFDIWYNYGRSDAVFITGANIDGDDNQWNARKLRLGFSRHDNEFSVRASTISSNHFDKCLTDVPIAQFLEFTLDDLEVLDKFKGGSGFGYGSYSNYGLLFKPNYAVRSTESDMYATATIANKSYVHINDNVKLLHYETTSYIITETGVTFTLLLPFEDYDSYSYTIDPVLYTLKNDVTDVANITTYTSRNGSEIEIRITGVSSRIKLCCEVFCKKNYI